MKFYIRYLDTGTNPKDEVVNYFHNEVLDINELYSHEIENIANAEKRGVFLMIKDSEEKYHFYPTKNISKIEVYKEPDPRLKKK